MRDDPNSRSGLQHLNRRRFLAHTTIAGVATFSVPAIAAGAIVDGPPRSTGSHTRPAEDACPMERETIAAAQPYAASNASLPINVRDFGAVGNGLTDDTAAFVAAMTALRTSGGGTIVVPPGSYVVGANIWGAFSLSGDAPGTLDLGVATILTSATQLPPSNWGIHGSRGGGTGAGFVDVHGGGFRWTGAAGAVIMKLFRVHNTHVRGVIFDANRAGASTCLVLDGDATAGTTRCTVEDCEFFRFREIGIAWAISSLTGQVDAIEITRCRFTGIGNECRGIVVNSANAAQTSVVRRCFFQNVRIGVDVLYYDSTLELHSCDFASLVGRTPAAIHIARAIDLLVENSRLEVDLVSSSLFALIDGLAFERGAVTFIHNVFGCGTGGRATGVGVLVNRACRIVSIGNGGPGQGILNDPHATVISMGDRFPDNAGEVPHEFRGWDVTANGAHLTVVDRRTGGLQPKCGDVRLVGGTATVMAPTINATTSVLYARQGVGGTPGFLHIANLVPGTSFDIVSSSSLDTSAVHWELVEQTS